MKEIVKELIIKNVKASTIDRLAAICPQFSEALNELIDNKIIVKRKNYFINKRSEIDDEVMNFIKNWMLPAFKQRNPRLIASPMNTYKRLIKFMEKHNVTLNEIKYATMLYLNNTNPKYIRYPHYFIEKKVNGKPLSDLLAYVNRVRESKLMGYSGLE